MENFNKHRGLQNRHRELEQAYIGLENNVSDQQDFKQIYFSKMNILQIPNKSLLRTAITKTCHYTNTDIVSHFCV